MVADMIFRDEVMTRQENNLKSPPGCFKGKCGGGWATMDGPVTVSEVDVKGKSDSYESLYVRKASTSGRAIRQLDADRII